MADCKCLYIRRTQIDILRKTTLHETRPLLPDGLLIDACRTIAILSFRLLSDLHKYTAITEFFSACNLQTIFYVLPSRNPTYTY